jgi:hypothetical protein
MALVPYADIVDEDDYDDDDEYDFGDDFESDDEQDLYVRLLLSIQIYNFYQVTLTIDHGCAFILWRLEMEVLVVEYHLLAHGGARKHWLWLSRSRNHSTAT